MRTLLPEFRAGARRLLHAGRAISKKNLIFGLIDWCRLDQIPLVAVEVEDVIVLPRSAVRENGEVYVVDGEDRLRFRSVEILRADREQVYIAEGLDAGDRVCTSPIEAPVDGMRVRAVVEKAAWERSGHEDLP